MYFLRNNKRSCAEYITRILSCFPKFNKLEIRNLISSPFRLKSRFKNIHTLQRGSEVWNGRFMRFFLKLKTNGNTRSYRNDNKRSYCTPSLIAALHIVNLIYVFPEMKQRGLIPSSYIHVSVSDLCIPTIDLPILLQDICGTILGKKIAHRHMIVEID